MISEKINAPNDVDYIPITSYDEMHQNGFFFSNIFPNIIVVVYTREAMEAS